MKYRTIKFRAVQVVKKPTTVQFFTKNGESVSFKATKAVEKPITVKFKAKKQ
jgi:hypothetical protein